MSENMVWNQIDSRSLMYGGQWSDVESSVRAKTFAVLVELAHDRVKYYVSDLYHDATWLHENLTGSMQFDWIARESGTFIGEVCLHIDVDNWSDARKYRFEILNEDGTWVLNIYEALDLNEINVQGPVEELRAAWDKVQETEDPLAELLDTCMGVSRPLETKSTIERKDGRPMLDDVINSLQQKLEELNESRQEAENAKEQLDEFLNDSEDAVSDYEEVIRAIESLSLPEISVNVTVDVAFDS